MQGEVKFFNKNKGWGYIKADNGKEYFFHYSQIQMDGFKSLHENDLVEYELGVGNDERQQAINVKPILTMRMIEDSLKEDNLYVHVRNIEDASGNKAYIVVDQNNVIQSSEQGMSFMELVAYANFEIVESQHSKCRRYRENIKNCGGIEVWN